MRPTLTRCTQAMACAAAVLSLAACGGDADGERTSATSSASSATSSEPTYDDDYAFAAVGRVDEEFRAHDANQPLPEDATWATETFRERYDAEVAEFKKVGAVKKGKVAVNSRHLHESDRDAVGGWTLSAYVCSTSTMRFYQDGKDVSSMPGDPSEPLPKGPRDGVHLQTYVTPDQGKTWQLDDVQLLSGKDAEESPCEVG